jgi:hypothetical protein
LAWNGQASEPSQALGGFEIPSKSWDLATSRLDTVSIFFGEVLETSIKPKLNQHHSNIKIAWFHMILWNSINLWRFQGPWALFRNGTQDPHVTSWTVLRFFHL